MFGLLFVPSTFIVDFSTNTHCARWTMYVHPCNFGALFAECKNAFCRCRSATWTYGNDKRSWGVDRVLACHVRAGLYKWIASPGPYLTGIRNINGQMRFCRRERMARGSVSIYPRRTILSRRNTSKVHRETIIRQKHFDYYFFLFFVCVKNISVIARPLFGRYSIRK